MAKEIKKNCYAKVNLSLDVIGKRADGYHNLEMIMQMVSLKDIINISVETEVSETNITVTCDNSDIPQNSDNLAAKAAVLFLEKAKIFADIKIQIEKNIPVGAGLGGGSSDAAGVLMGLNELLNFPLSQEEMAEVAAGIGSDVPFFLYGKTMLAEGTGTRLSPILLAKEMSILIAKPEFSVSTPHVYKNLKLDDKTVHPNTKKVIEALGTGNLEMLGENTGNVLETVTAAEHEEIDRYKDSMLKNGAIYALMSGSGPSVFGVFDSEEKMHAAYDELRKVTKEAYITKTV